MVFQPLKSLSALLGLLAISIAITAPLWGGSDRSWAADGFTEGQLLVATQQMPDPTFGQTVIYMVEHNDKGALGLVLNRPLGTASVASLYDRMGLDSEGVSGEVKVHSGGPVEPGTVFILHEDSYRSDETAPLAEGLAITTHPNILAKIADGSGPSAYLFALGYAGWAPGQLEQEIGNQDWVAVELNHEILFDPDDQSKWDRAIALYAIEL